MSMRRLNRAGALTLGLAVLAGAVAFAPGAGASTPKSVLVFSGGKGFASIYGTDSTGKGLKRLLNGSAAPFSKRYGSPSISRNGKLLAYTLGYNLYVLNLSTGHKTGPLSKAAWLARLSPDGQKVGDLEQYPGGHLAISTFNASGAGTHHGRTGLGMTSSFSFTGDDRVLAAVSDQYDAATSRYETGIGLMAQDGTGVEGWIAFTMGYDLLDPALSPNGKLLAVTRSAPGAAKGKSPSTTTRRARSCRRSPRAARTRGRSGRRTGRGSRSCAAPRHPRRTSTRSRRRAARSSRSPRAAR